VQSPLHRCAATSDRPKPIVPEIERPLRYVKINPTREGISSTLFLKVLDQYEWSVMPFGQTQTPVAIDYIEIPVIWVIPD
jgi:hypothetical protein